MRALGLGRGAWDRRRPAGLSGARARAARAAAMASLLLVLTFCTFAPLAAQQPPEFDRNVCVALHGRWNRLQPVWRGLQPAPAPAPAPADETLALPARRARTRPLWLAAISGATAGAVLGVEGLNFSAYPPSVRATRRWRAGVSFGLIGAGLGMGLAAVFDSPPHAPPTREFFLGRWQTPLLAGMLAAQVLDFTSTRYFRDRGMPEWLLTDRLVDNRAALVATEAAGLAAAVGLAYVLYRTGHPRWARWFEGGYITIGAVSAVANYRYPATGRDLF